MQKDVDENDVIVLATYLKNPIAKIGVIKKGTKFYDSEEDYQYKIFQFEKETVKEFEISRYQIFNSIIPSRLTISPIQKRKDFIRAIYNENLKELPVNINFVSEKLIELMCLEWLRSDFSGNFKLKYQLLLTGGSIAKIDILGVTIDDKKLVAQVSYTDDKSLIQKKINKINELQGKYDHKIIFCNIDSQKIKDVHVINLESVWKKLFKNGYKKMLESFVRE